MKRKPEEVFTPRAYEVNDAMYVARADLEKALESALRGDKQVIVHGESGTGKSWLYKKVLADQGYEWVVADLANASRFKSVTREFANIIERRERAHEVSYSETKEASAGVPGFGGGKLGHTGTFKLDSKEPYEQCLEFVRKKAEQRGAAIVLDNFERIITSPELIKEIADLLTLTDNADYARYKVKLVVVGVPNDLRSYFAKVDQQNTVANRLTEIPEVARLEKPQVAVFVEKGFAEELGVRVSAADLAALIEHVSWVTDGIPQQLHEYCYELALIAEQSADTLVLADHHAADVAWLKGSLMSSYTIVEAHMNSKTTVAGRRNQVMYALGACKRQEFKYDDIEQVVRQEFPESTTDKQLNVSQILSSLAIAEVEAAPPLIVRTPKADAYRLVNPKYRMCIRSMLQKDVTGNRVVKREFGSLDGQ